MKQNELKQSVGIKAVDFIQEGMTVGLGTGSTVYYLVEELGRRVQEKQLQVQCVSTSQRTWDQACALGITMKPLQEVSTIDLTIDGADEIDPDFQGIKGGGAAHTYEKIVAVNSRKNIWIVDESKLVDQLGAFGLPVEVLPFGAQQLFQRFQAEGLQPKLRLDDQQDPVHTDSQNYVFDLELGTIKHPHLLAQWLEEQAGVVEQGLFLDLVNTVIIGTDQGPKIISDIR
ncbi:ribose-5-phosphate isomerase RpiA [Lactobacillus sp. DCY120]|uniref:Ribose-5-phosphate isomerase A n=1 Tax=Bombilactobacillus apium TaxID=2675299 RepID=A0A850R569_9LACO|nr:ribose-5-phosphate isomerase RpiA [Bombilactobacillus apium]NVY95997.1 ribose-5-phosphate isomerase RpiA [Bombilactobacillus apium]